MIRLAATEKRGIRLETDTHAIKTDNKEAPRKDYYFWRISVNRNIQAEVEVTVQKWQLWEDWSCNLVHMWERKMHPHHQLIAEKLLCVAGAELQSIFT